MGGFHRPIFTVTVQYSFPLGASIHGYYILSDAMRVGRDYKLYAYMWSSTVIMNVIIVVPWPLAKGNGEWRRPPVIKPTRTIPVLTTGLDVFTIGIVRLPFPDLLGMKGPVSTHETRWF